MLASFEGICQEAHLLHQLSIKQSVIKECKASPWSNNSPKGPDVPVRLACFPSMASRDW